MAGILIEWRIEELLLGSMGEAEKEAGVNTGTRLAITTPISLCTQTPAFVGSVSSGHSTQKGSPHQEESATPGSSPWPPKLPQKQTMLRENFKIGN